MDLVRGRNLVNVDRGESTGDSARHDKRTRYCTDDDVRTYVCERGRLHDAHASRRSRRRRRRRRLVAVVFDGKVITSGLINISGVQYNTCRA